MIATFLFIMFLICISPIAKPVIVETWKYLNGR